MNMFLKAGGEATLNSMNMRLGEQVQLTLYGSSHGPHVGATLTGVPEGLNVDHDAVAQAMRKRRPGGKYSSKRREADEVEWLSGVTGDRTTGETLECRIHNNDVRSSDYSFLPDHPRPGHQDLVMMVKTNGAADLRGGGTSSARMTAPLVAMAAVLRPWLANHGVEVRAHVGNIGGIEALPVDECLSVNLTDTCEALRCHDPEAAERMAALIETTRRARDSLGSRVDMVITGLPMGVGEPWFDGLEPALARALMAVPAARAVEFGRGTNVIHMKGSEHNDPWGGSVEAPELQGDRPDGALAGMASGAPLRVSVSLKPPSSIPQEQRTLNLRTGQPEPLLVKGRHDPVLAPRGVAVVEAMAVLVLTDLMVRGHYLEA